jgi:hypothetical protein
MVPEANVENTQVNIPPLQKRSPILAAQEGLLIMSKVMEEAARLHEKLQVKGVTPVILTT